MRWIEGVTITPLKQISDRRGCIYHIFRKDDPDFNKFGEVYISEVHPHQAKGLHRHSTMELNYVCIQGSIDLVIIPDLADKQDFMKVRMGEDAYCRVKVPPGVWNGFVSVGFDSAKVVNVATEPYREGEKETQTITYGDFMEDFGGGLYVSL